MPNFRLSTPQHHQPAQESFALNQLSSHLSQLHLAFCDSLTVASSTLTTWLSHLRSLASSAAAPAQPDPYSAAALSQKISSFIDTHSTASYTTLAATLLGLLFLCAKYLMSSYRGDTFYEGRSGRHSPYTSYQESQSSNISDYVEYGHGSFSSHPDQRYEQDFHRPSVARPYHPPQQFEPDNAPDVLLLRHKHVTYELRFVPFAIAEGKVNIKHIRHWAAEKVSTSPHRLTLLYKGRKLVEDSWSAKEYGLKQNSEISCVVIDPSVGGSGDSQSSSDDDSGSTVSNHRHHGHSTKHPRRRRPRGQSTARHRSEVDLPFTATTQAEYLHPTSTGARQSRPVERSSGDSLNIPNGHDRHRSHSRGPSPGPSYHYPTQTYTAPPPQPTATAVPQSYPQQQRPSPPPSNVDPSSPLGKLIALLNTLRNTWIPQCNRFIASPPTDIATRDKEYKKLSECVLAQVVLKADDIETNGDLECRKMRKRVVNEANEIMKALDVVGKRQ